MNRLRWSTALAAGLVTGLALAAPAQAAVLDVTVAGIANDRGEVRIAACERDVFLSPKCTHRASAPARPGEVTLKLLDLPPGVYAVQAYHDENVNRDIDRSFFGTPREGIGFSNDAPMNFGPPAFDDAAVRVDSEPVAIELNLRYFD